MSLGKIQDLLLYFDPDPSGCYGVANAHGPSLLPTRGIFIGLHRIQVASFNVFYAPYILHIIHGVITQLALPQFSFHINLIFAILCLTVFVTSIRSLAEILWREIQNLKYFVRSLPYNLQLESFLKQNFEVISNRDVVR